VVDVMLCDINKTYMNMLGMCRDVKCPNIVAHDLMPI
jgi:hypothetical protein